MAKISVFIPYLNNSITDRTVQTLSSSPLIDKIFILSQEKLGFNRDKVTELIIDPFKSSHSIRTIAEHANSDYVLFITKPVEINFNPYTLGRLLKIAQDTQAGILYSNYFEIKNNTTQPHPVIDYQLGSVRDDFDFGPLLFINSKALKSTASTIKYDYMF